MNTIKVPGDSALELAVASLENQTRTIICGDDDELENLLAQIESVDDDPMYFVECAEDVDIFIWLSDRMEEIEEEYEIDEEALVGPWPDKMDVQEFVLNTDITTGQVLPSVNAIEVVADESWHLPALLNFGGWNDCPDPEIHCAMWQYWQKTYDAHIVAMSHDVIEAKVLRPPRTRDQAMELAWQQYLYCSEIVDEGVQSLSNLAASLIDHDLWYFWWE